MHSMMSPFGHDLDVYYMRQALEQAQKAYEKDEVPVGAVLVSSEGSIVGRAHNEVEQQNTQIAHAEMLVMQRVSAEINNWRLEGYWLYVTLEPCSMCINCMKLSRLKGVVFGATSPLFGYHLDNDMSVQLYKKDCLQIIGNVEGQEAAILLKTFFQNQRKKGG